MSIQYPFLEPHQTTCHSNIGVVINKLTKWGLDILVVRLRAIIKWRYVLGVYIYVCVCMFAYARGWWGRTFIVARYSVRGDALGGLPRAWHLLSLCCGWGNWVAFDVVLLTMRWVRCFMYVDWRFLCGCRWEFESKEGSSHNVTECTPVVSSKVMNRGTCHPRDWRCWASWFYIFNFLSMALFWELVMLMLYIHVHRIRQSLIVSCTFLCPFMHISLTFQGYKLRNSM